MKVYLIYSDSYKRINDKVNEIVNNSLNVIKYNLNNSSLKDIIEEANYFSLTGEEKYIIVKSYDYFSSKKSSEEKNDDINAFVEVDIERARKTAAEVDEKIQTGYRILQRRLRCRSGGSGCETLSYSDHHPRIRYDTGSCQ